MRSGIYVGRVTHRRVRTRPHDLRYTLFYLLLDLDELPDLQRAGLFGWNRPALLSFHDADHGRGDGRPFAVTLRETLRDAGFEARRWRFEVLCLPRVLGYVFNPISVVYCRDDTRLVAMVYEVNNTFGGREHYVLPVAEDVSPAVIRQRCAKTMYVSPFFDVAGGYRFDLTPAADRVALSIRHEDEQGLRLHAGFTGRRLPWTAANLARCMLRFPFATLKVIVGIHWEALALWRKGVPLHPRPAHTEPEPDVRTIRH